MTTAKPVPRSPTKRGDRTRNALISAGHRLLAERSIDALAVDDIVQAAGVAKGSFYNHFEDKHDLASTIRDDIRVEIQAAISRVNADVEDPAARVARALAVYVEYLMSSQLRAHVVLRISAGIASTENPLNAGVMSDVASGLRSGRFVVPSVQAGALFVIGAGQIALMHAVEEPSPAAAVMVAQQLTSLLLRGLGVAPAESEALSAAAAYELVALRDQLPELSAH